MSSNTIQDVPFVGSKNEVLTSENVFSVLRKMCPLRSSEANKFGRLVSYSRTFRVEWLMVEWFSEKCVPFVLQKPTNLDILNRIQDI